MLSIKFFEINWSMQRLIVAIISLIGLLSDGVGAYKILISAPTISKSHIISNGRVADTLVADGNDVTIMEIEYMVPIGHMKGSKMARILQIPGKFLDYKVPGTNESVDISELMVKYAFDADQHSLFKIIEQSMFFKQLINKFYEACEVFLTTQHEQLELLRAEHFDLIIGEQYDLCGAGLSYALNIPAYVMVHSLPLTEVMTSILGLPNPSSWVPALNSDNSDKMTMYGRFENLMRQLLHYSADSLNAFQQATAIFRKHYGVNFPDIVDIVKNSPFIFVNVDEFVEFPRPLFPHIVYIGGIGMREKMDQAEHEHTEQYRAEMSKGKNGVILFSLGSIVRSTHLPENFRRNILNAFAQFSEYHFIVKMEKDDNFSLKILQQNPQQNVFLTDWLPQVALLNHPRLKLFISHGGYNSLMEAAWAGVPLLTLPFFIDQHRNARLAERNGWALPFDKNLLLEGSGEFIAAIQHVLGEQNYTDKAKRIRNLIRNKPFSAEERLQKSIRFLEANGGHLPELLPESRNMSTVALYNLDLMFLALVALFTAILALYFLIKLICRFFTRLFWKDKGKKKSA